MEGLQAFETVILPCLGMRAYKGRLETVMKRDDSNVLWDLAVAHGFRVLGKLGEADAVFERGLGTLGSTSFSPQPRLDVAYGHFLAAAYLIGVDNIRARVHKSACEAILEAIARKRRKVLDVAGLNASSRDSLSILSRLLYDFHELIPQAFELVPFAFRHFSSRDTEWIIALFVNLNEKDLRLAMPASPSVPSHSPLTEEAFVAAYRRFGAIIEVTFAIPPPASTGQAERELLALTAGVTCDALPAPAGEDSFWQTLVWHGTTGPVVARERRQREHSSAPLANMLEFLFTVITEDLQSGIPESELCYGPATGLFASCLGIMRALLPPYPTPQKASSLLNQALDVASRDDSINLLHVALFYTIVLIQGAALAVRYNDVAAMERILALIDTHESFAPAISMAGRTLRQAYESTIASNHTLTTATTSSTSSSLQLSPASTTATTTTTTTTTASSAVEGTPAGLFPLASPELGGPPELDWFLGDVFSLDNVAQSISL